MCPTDKVLITRSILRAIPLVRTTSKIETNCSHATQRQYLYQSTKVAKTRRPDDVQRSVTSRCWEGATLCYTNRCLWLLQQLGLPLEGNRLLQHRCRSYLECHRWCSEYHQGAGRCTSIISASAWVCWRWLGSDDHGGRPSPYSSQNSSDKSRFCSVYTLINQMIYFCWLQTRWIWYRDLVSVRNLESKRSQVMLRIRIVSRAWSGSLHRSKVYLESDTDASLWVLTKSLPSSFTYSCF